MRHYRRSSRPKRRQHNTVWQPQTYAEEIANLPSKTGQNRFLFTLTPGVSTGNIVDPFDDQHVLERIRGTFFHDVKGSTGYGGAVLLNLAAFKVPAAVSKSISNADMPNLFESGAGEDFPLFYNCVCGTLITDNVSLIEGKSKRRFDPGDVLVFCISYYNSDTATTLDMSIGLNLRILWKLLG